MTNFSLYSIQVSIVFSLLFIVYKMTLSRLTFHTTNRCILLSLIPISFLLPFVDGLLPSISEIVFDASLYSGHNPIAIENFKATEILMAYSTINYWSILLILYCLGLIFTLIKLFFDITALIIKKQNSTNYHKEGYKLVITDNPQVFSFFNWIFVPLKKQDNLIIEHEKAHIKLKHSIDIILIELFIAFLWYNPFVYFFRRELKSVHEFQADTNVLSKKIKTSQYLQVLLQNLEVKKPNNIYSYLNYPVLKRRIDMITKTKSTQLSKLKYLILLSVCTLLSLAFTKPKIKSIPVLATFSLSTDMPSVFPVKNMTKNDITAFFTLKSEHPKTKETIIHGGIDIRARIGTPIIATADGIISKANIEGDWGNLIVIAHDNNYQTWYAHLKDFNITENQMVKKGDVIGYVGNTGKSTGSHLHYEVKHNGKSVNPIDYIAE